MAVSLVDSHCHIPLIEGMDGADSIISTALKYDVIHMLCVSIDLESYPVILELVNQYSCISASAPE